MSNVGKAPWIMVAFAQSTHLRGSCYLWVQWKFKECFSQMAEVGRVVMRKVMT